MWWVTLKFHQESPDVSTHMGSNHEQVEDGKNGSLWSENDFPDLFEKPETQEDDDTIALEEGDFAPKMENPQAENLKKSDIGKTRL